MKHYKTQIIWLICGSIITLSLYLLDYDYDFWLLFSLSAFPAMLGVYVGKKKNPEYKYSKLSKSTSTIIWFITCSLLLLRLLYDLKFEVQNVLLGGTILGSFGFLLLVIKLGKHSNQKQTESFHSH